MVGVPNRPLLHTNNQTPNTPRTGTAASDISTFFNSMWLEQTGEALPAVAPHPPLPCEQDIEWHDSAAPFATRASRPSILGYTHTHKYIYK